MDITHYIEAKKKLIDNAINKYLPSSSLKPQIIHRTMRYAVFPGGKRIRPILTIAGFEMCGGRDIDILPIACAIELVHTYTLIHDDLPCMDNDDYRRGRLTCHKKFGEDIALLAGDALLTLGFQVLSEANNIDVIKEISMAIGTRGTIGGQALEIGYKKSQKAKVKSQKKLMHYINSKKTGALFETALKVGGIFKGVDRKRLNGLSKFGRLIGWTFQLIDDLIDGDGYVKVYGVDYVRKKAVEYNIKAKDSLDIFGTKACRLSELADWLTYCKEIQRK